VEQLLIFELEPGVLFVCFTAQEPPTFVGGSIRPHTLSGKGISPPLPDFSNLAGHPDYCVL
jgi:hypothetical protein